MPGVCAVGLFAGACGAKLPDPSSWATAVTPSTSADATSVPSAVATLPTWQANPPKSEPDDEVFREVAVKSCLDQAQGEGTSADQAEAYCDCAVDEVMKNMTSDELRQIGKAGLSGNQALPPGIDQKLTDAISACVDNLTQ